MKQTVLQFLFLVMLYPVLGQDSISSSLEEKLNEVVITAARKKQHVDDVSLPMMVLGEKQIQLSGLSHLNELLEEQSGMVISEGHGSGIQIQGFDPEYTMVLVDNEPIIGRVAGVLDLKRISLRNIEHIEILKGASSCLFGSNAMAGVVNIITRKPELGMELGVFSKVRLPLLFENSLHFSKGFGRQGLSFFYSRIDNAGFRLNSNQAFKTAPSHRENHSNLKWYSEWGKWSVSTTIRYAGLASPKQKIDNQNGVFESESETKDASLGIGVKYKLNKQLTLKANAYKSQYNSSDRLWADETLPTENTFKQDYSKMEFVAQYDGTQHHQLILGIGVNTESVNTPRFQSAPSFNTLFAFVQDEWKISKSTNLSMGVRYDIHNTYGSQLSPKVSALRKLNRKWKIKASVGSGFKSPDLRQLYLNFSNPIVGYDVFGVKVLQDRLDELESQNQIQRIVHTVDETLEAERSMSLNASIIWQWHKSNSIDINGFYNHVNGMINSIAVAQKNNGQLVYSYENLSQFTTKGIALSSKNQLTENLKVNLGGQFLITADADQKKAVKNGEVFVRNSDNNETRAIVPLEYMGLFSRSKYNANASIQYLCKSIETNFFIRYNWRSAYALFDSNGNSIYDAFDERSGDFHQFNITLSKTIKSFVFQASVINVLNNTSVQFLPNNPGVQCAFSANYTYKQKPKKNQFLHP